MSHSGLQSGGDLKLSPPTPDFGPFRSYYETFFLETYPLVPPCTPHLGKGIPPTPPCTPTPSRLTPPEAPSDFFGFWRPQKRTCTKNCELGIYGEVLEQNLHCGFETEIPLVGNNSGGFGDQKRTCAGMLSHLACVCAITVAVACILYVQIIED